MQKLGMHTDNGKTYEGGFVFRTVAEATQYLVRHPELAYSVYGLILPNGWEQDVRDILPGEDHHRLKNDAVIVRVGTL